MRRLPQRNSSDVNTALFPSSSRPGHWNSVRIAPDERTRHAREILQRTDLSAATGRQFLADRLLSECPNLGGVPGGRQRRLRALAIATPVRIEELPDVPTVAESPSTKRNRGPRLCLHGGTTRQ